MSGILYLNESHLDSLDLDSARIVDLLEEVFRTKARGETEMPPKIFFQMEGDRFYSAMVSCCPPLGFAGSKWQSGDPANPARGLPYVQGLFVLTEHESGRMVAVMDSKWITGKRTAAASALVARYQARAGSARLALLGCGVQGRAHLETLAAELPSLETCRVYDVDAERQAAFVAELDGRYSGIRVTGALDAESAVRGADVIIPGGAIQAERNATIVSDWVEPGALIVTIDYDSYVTDECIEAMDVVLTDDRGQVENAQRTEGKFLGVERFDTDIASMIAAGEGLRENDRQRILAFNLGIALEDVATAAELYGRAQQRGIGVRLEA